MKKQYRIKKNVEFQKVFKHGKNVANRQFVIYFLKKEGQANFRIGLSVSKQIGNAVTRNRVKRLIRESFHQLKDDLPKSYDFVVIARKPSAQMTFNHVKTSLIHVLKLAKVLPRDYGKEKQIFKENKK